MADRSIRFTGRCYREFRGPKWRRFAEMTPLLGTVPRGVRHGLRLFMAKAGNARPGFASGKAHKTVFYLRKASARAVYLQAVSYLGRSLKQHQLQQTATGATIDRTS